MTTASFPSDLDTTSIACMVSDHFSAEVKNDIMDEILTLKNQDGIIQTYFDVTRPRIGTRSKNILHAPHTHIYQIPSSASTCSHFSTPTAAAANSKRPLTGSTAS